jgi:hypothetical protein
MPLQTAISTDLLQLLPSLYKMNQNLHSGGSSALQKVGPEPSKTCTLPQMPLFREAGENLHSYSIVPLPFSNFELILP